MTDFGIKLIISSKAVGPPSVNSFNAYDVPLKVEETYDNPPLEEDQDVYFIFYEDNQSEEQPSVSHKNFNGFKFL